MKLFNNSQIFKFFSFNNLLNEKILIFLLLISLPFTHINLALQKTNIITGNYGWKLIIYPILLIIVYFMLNRNTLADSKKFSVFIKIYFSVSIISFMNALIIYPYYSELYDMKEIPEKIYKIVNLINIDEKNIVDFWLIARMIRQILIETLFTFGVSYILYLIYVTNKFDIFKVIVKSIKVVLSFAIVYSIVELNYFMNNSWAEDILVLINPYIHTIKTSHDWWPQLLLRNQLRSFFVEPSYLAMYGAVALPFLWSCLYAKQRKNDIVVNILFISALSFFMFLTKSRMATAFMILNITLLIIFTAYYYKKMIKNTCIILICTSIAFFGAVLFSEKYMSPNNMNANSNFEQYIDNNVKSIASINERSNGTRYGVMYADFLIGKDNLLFGVGEVLRNRYMIDYLPDWSLEKNETKMWVNAVKEKGILQSGFPNLNEYLYRFSTTGLLGLSVFLFPIFLLMIKLFNVFRFNKYFNVNFVFFTIAFIASCATGVGDSVTRIYWFWILLPLGYAMCFGKENDVKYNGDTGSRQEH